MIRIPEIVDIAATEDTCTLLLEDREEIPSQSNEPFSMPEFRRNLSECAKTVKQQFYRDLLLQNPDIREFTFRSLEIEKESIIKYYEIMESSISANIVQIINNELCVGQRPKLEDLLDLRDEGFTHIVTVLGESEGALDIGNAAEKLGFHWIWLPLGNAKVPILERDSEDEIHCTIRELKSLFRDGKPGARVYLHCSAGFHRTGMISLLLLRKLGYDEEEAMDFLEQLREETARNVGQQRISWAMRF